MRRNMGLSNWISASVIVISIFISSASGDCSKRGFCSQICVPTPSLDKKVHCNCVDGYYEDPNDWTRCKAREGHTFLLFGSGSEIKRVAPNANRTKDAARIGGGSGEVLTIITNASDVAALDFNYRTGMIFWADKKKETVFKAPINEGHSRSTVISNARVSSVAVDWVHSHLYWTTVDEIIGGQVRVANLEGRMAKTLFRGDIVQPTALAINPATGWLYWSDAAPDGAAKIERAGMDGSLRETIVSSGLGLHPDMEIIKPTGLTVDFVLGELLWVDADAGALYSCQVDGGANVRRLADLRQLSRISNIGPMGNPTAIATFEDWVYWSDNNPPAIYRLNKFSGDNASVVLSGEQMKRIIGLQVYHSARQPEVPNLCSPINGHCSHLCLPAPLVPDISTTVDPWTAEVAPSDGSTTTPPTAAPRITCVCPEGMWIGEDKRTCEGSGYFDGESLIGGSTSLLIVVISAVSILLIVTLVIVVVVILLRRGSAPTSAPMLGAEDEETGAAATTNNVNHHDVVENGDNKQPLTTHAAATDGEATVVDENTKPLLNDASVPEIDAADVAEAES